MDPEVCKSICKLINKLSTSGKMTIDSKGVKDLIHYAGKSEDYLKFAHEKLLKQLKKKHSQIRYGTFLIINEFFKKSGFYRELLLDEFHSVLALTVGNDVPDPPETAEDLKKLVALSFQTWHRKFAKKHHRLTVAYNYIKNVLKIDLDSESNTVPRPAQPEVNGPRGSKELEALQAEISEREGDISELVTEMRNSFNLIVSRPEEFLGEDNSNTVDVDNDEEGEVFDMRAHGFTAKTTITIDFNPAAASQVIVTGDNEAVIENLKGLYNRANRRFIPLINRWERVASRLGNAEVRARIEELKASVNAETSRFQQLEIHHGNFDFTEDVSESNDSDEDSDDDDDFEEVPEKHGYEELAIAPPVVPKPSQTLPPVDDQDPQPSTSRSALPSWRIGAPEHSEEFHDPTYGLQPEILIKVAPGGSKKQPASTSQQANISDRKSKLLAVAPKVPFDIDLYHWEDKNLKAPTIEIADGGMHRFWQPLDREGEEIENPDGIAALRTRTIEFTGEFQPVRWTCRAPLPSGKLCPRQDRVTCPFHGKIIARDEEGIPTNPDDIARLEKEKEIADKNKVPEWQDPKLLKELKEKTGLDLTIRPPKKGGKSFAEKYPNLKDIRKPKETSRSRLEKKIFSKRAIKRVAESLDTISRKRGREKFGDQFNYTD